jgi:hypothetical protein
MNASCFINHTDFHYFSVWLLEFKDLLSFIILWHTCPKQELLNHRNLERHTTVELCLRSMSVYCLLLGNACNSEFAAVSAVTVAMQWFGKYVSTIETKFSVRSAWRLYNAPLVIFSSQFEVVLSKFHMRSECSDSDEWITVTRQQIRTRNTEENMESACEELMQCAYSNIESVVINCNSTRWKSK